MFPVEKDSIEPSHLQKRPTRETNFSVAIQVDLIGGFALPSNGIPKATHLN
jgi:hypothetical protein